MCSGQKQEGYLVEAKLVVEESSLPRGTWLAYQYGVKQRQKEIREVATRHVQIPPESDIKGKLIIPACQHTAQVCLNPKASVPSRAVPL